MFSNFLSTPEGINKYALSIIVSKSTEVQFSIRFLPILHHGFASAACINLIGSRVRQEPKASVLAAYKICDLAYKILKV
jgi:hypothetical protein